MSVSRTEEVGQSAIAAYKGIKGAIELVLALVLGLATLVGARVDASIVHVGHALRHGVVEAWSIELAALLTPTHVAWTALALLLDGALTTLEGWALRRGHSWGPWLVVVATSCFIPFEIIAVAHHARVLRIAMLVLNVAIVAFLARKALHATPRSPSLGRSRPFSVRPSPPGHRVA